MTFARRTMTFDAADLGDTDAIKTSVATQATPQTYGPEDLNGAAQSPEAFAGFEQVGGIPSVTTGANVGSYVVGSTVTFVGTWDGQEVRRVATLTDADGGETLLADGPLDGAPTSLEVEAQANGSGSLIFGWGGVAPLMVPKGRQRLWWLRCGDTSGDIAVRYPLGEDVIEAVAGQEYPAAIAALLAETAVTVVVFEA